MLKTNMFVLKCHLRQERKKLLYQCKECLACAADVGHSGVLSK